MNEGTIGIKANDRIFKNCIWIRKTNEWCRAIRVFVGEIGAVDLFVSGSSARHDHVVSVMTIDLWLGSTRYEFVIKMMEIRSVEELQQLLNKVWSFDFSMICLASTKGIRWRIPRCMLTKIMSYLFYNNHITLVIGHCRWTSKVTFMVLKLSSRKYCYTIIYGLKTHKSFFLRSCRSLENHSHWTLTLNNHN